MQTQTQKINLPLTSEVTVSILDHCYDLPPKTDTEMLHAAREEIARLQQRTAALEMNIFFLERFLNDSSLIQFYTGFKDYATLKDVFSSLTPTDNNIIKWRQCQQEGDNSVSRDSVSEEETLSLIDQFFLFLCKVRQGFHDQDLAVRFNISQSRVIRITITWANYLYLVLGEVPLWRSRETGKQDIPDCYKASYPQARVILHCAEVKVEIQNAPAVSSQLYTYYHKQTTYKGLLGIAPHGAVIFISPLYSGSASKRDITKSSGILDLLEPGDLVFTDKDFLIQDLVESVDAFLVIPPIITTAASPEECNEATVMLSQSTEEQNTMIILAPSIEQDQETLVMTSSTGLEDAVVELEQSAEEDDDVDVGVKEEEVETHLVNMEELMVDQGHLVTEEAEIKESSKIEEQVVKFTNEEVVVTSQNPERLVEDCTGLDKEINALARLRICVDQDIERVRQYHLFDKVLPLTLGGTVNQIWAVCAMLTNINGSLN
ncbi:uncharacterized protein LOC128644978 isoform X2 [Bombina bombina]|nr:uncharacterized protein LOC128644978 isoform X2 [Bombina bombina]